MKTLLSRFMHDEGGATAIEYGLIAAGIAVVIIPPCSWSARIFPALSTTWRTRSSERSTRPIASLVIKQRLRRNPEPLRLVVPGGAEWWAINCSRSHRRDFAGRVLERPLPFGQGR